MTRSHGPTPASAVERVEQVANCTSARAGSGGDASVGMAGNTAGAVDTIEQPCPTGFSKLLIPCQVKWSESPPSPPTIFFKSLTFELTLFSATIKPARNRNEN